MMTARTANASIDAAISFGLDKTVAVDAQLLYGICQSLAPDALIDFQLNGSALNWTTRKAESSTVTANGKLSIVTPDRQHTPLGRSIKDGVSIPATPALARVFELGGLSAQNGALASIGLWGVVVHPDEDDLWILSSDSLSISAACCPVNVALPETELTLLPAETALMATLIERGRDESGVLSISNKEMLYRDLTLKAVVTFVEPLKKSIWKMADEFMSAERVMPLEKDRVAAFVRRAAALAETRQNCLVKVLADGNHLTLQFQEALAQTEEYYLIPKFKVAEPCEVTLDARKLGRALSYCDEIILDHMHDRSIMMFRATDSSFWYMLAPRPRA